MDSLSIFEILIREQAPSLRAFLRSVVRQEAAVDDLFQETLLVAWKNLDRFDRTRPFGPWLRGIAGNLVMAWRRQAGAQPLLCDAAILEQVEGRFAQLHGLPGDSLDEKLVALRDCLQELPPDYRQAIDLRYFQELMPAAISNTLQINVETIKKRLHRARCMLLQCLTGKLTPQEGTS